MNCEPDSTIDEMRSREDLDARDVERLHNLAKAFPDDARLWDFLGDIACIVDGYNCPGAFPLQCYVNALTADPNYGPAHESLGHWFDLSEDYDAARRHFEKAVELGMGDLARIGLARIYAQLRMNQHAYRVLDSCSEPNSDAVLNVRREIAEELLGPYIGSSD